MGLLLYLKKESVALLVSFLFYTMLTFVLQQKGRLNEVKKNSGGMSNDSGQSYNLEAYIRQGEPEQAEKNASWLAAIGLQDVDGLKVSPYLLETAQEHIEGKIDKAAVRSRLHNYYEQRRQRLSAEDNCEEADLVSMHIAELLQEQTFQFSSAYYKSLHKRLFLGVFEHAGQFRTYNITKKEWVLKGATVYYAPYDSLQETLDYDLAQEKLFPYDKSNMSQIIKHIAKFTAGLWQIHPFCEGNTRTTAVFVIKYLRTLGFRLNNDIFANNSWYFRNALVRANYNNLPQGIYATTQYLQQFLENLLLGADHKLKNRHLHIDYKD